MQTKQEPVDSLNLVYVCVYFANKHDIVFIEAVKLVQGEEKVIVFSHNTRKYYSMGIMETSLQYLM